MTKFVGLRAKTYSYLRDDGSKDKKAKGKKSVIKRKRKFENYEKCLEETHFEKKTNYLEKNKIDIDSIKELKKKSILKIQYRFKRFKSERYNVFTVEIDKTALSSNDDKKCNQLIR